MLSFLNGVGHNTQAGAPSSAGSALSYIPDDTDALGVYGTRVMVDGYTGSLIRVNNGSTELDIGSDGQNLDTAALDTHLAGGNGTIVKVYDQLGVSANDLTISGNIQINDASRDADGIQPLNFNGGEMSIPSGVTGDGRDVSVYMIAADMGIPSTSTTKALYSLGAVWNTAGSHAFLGQRPNRVLSSSAFLPLGWEVSTLCQRQIVGSHSSPSEITVNVNGNTDTVAATAAGTFVGGRIGDLNLTGWTFFGQMYGFIVYDGERSASVASDVSALASVFDVDTSNDHNLLVVGDSIPFGTGSNQGSEPTMKSYVRLAEDSYDEGVDVRNAAIFGQNASGLYSSRTDYAGAYNAGKTYTNNIAYIHIGTNDIANGTSASDVWSNSIQPMITYLDGLGFDVVVGTIINRTVTGAYSAADETQRGLLNTEILDSSNQSTYNYSVADFTGITVALSDGTHPSTAGHAQMATPFAAAINATI